MGGELGGGPAHIQKKTRDLTTSRVVVRRCDTIYLSAMVDSGKNMERMRHNRRSKCRAGAPGPRGVVGESKFGAEALRITNLCGKLTCVVSVCIF